ncbi:M56 family metallopeptidase [Bremerella sp. JC770]|uniref:M56 family metallopeptidase n=1 Tax=Bremerella sp. JC770 TaxID=3232137 RepID=UPI00345A2A10
MWSVLQSPLGMKLTFVLLHFVWQAAVLYCAWRLISTLAPFGTPQARYGGALATLLLILLCPAITFSMLDIRELPSLSRWEHVAEDALPQDASVSPLDREVATTAGETPSALDVLPTATARSSDTFASAAYLMVQVQPYLMLVWTAGVIVLGFRLCISYLGTVWLRRVGLVALESDLLVRYAHLATRLNLLPLPPVAFSQRVGQAMTVGLLRPMVLLPAAWMTEISPEVLEAVLSHELAHIRRQDLWINFLQRVAETIFFYHPVVWWISSEIRHEREICCDAMAIEASGQRLGYAKSLEQIASWQHNHSQAALAAHFLGDRQGQLLGRVRQILGISTPQAGERSWPAGLVLMVIPLMLWATSAILWPESAAQANAEETAEHSNAMIEDESVGPWRLPPRRLPPPPRRHDHPRGLRHPLERLLDDIEQAIPSDAEAAQADEQQPSDQSVIEVLHELRLEVRQLRSEVQELKDHRPPPPRHRPPHDRRGRPHPQDDFGW